MCQMQSYVQHSTRVPKVVANVSKYDSCSGDKNIPRHFCKPNINDNSPPFVAILGERQECRSYLYNMGLFHYDTLKSSWLLSAGFPNGLSLMAFQSTFCILLTNPTSATLRIHVNHIYLMYLGNSIEYYGLHYVVS